MIPADGDLANVHASCVAVEGRGLLICGPSGSGKSALALQLMALGAELVADDRVILQRSDAQVMAHCPPALQGMIEARGLGLLRARPLSAAPLALVADLGTAEADRLPPWRHVAVLGLQLPLVLRGDAAHFSFALLQYLRCGRAQ